MAISQISIKKSGGGYNYISVAEFLGKSLQERTSLIVQNKIIFLDESGEVIPILDAMKQLRE